MRFKKLFEQKMLNEGWVAILARDCSYGSKGKIMAKTEKTDEWDVQTWQNKIDKKYGNGYIQFKHASEIE